MNNNENVLSKKNEEWNWSNNKKVRGFLIVLVGLITMVTSYAFFTDSKENILGFKINSYTPPHIVFEYDLSKGDGYVNARDEDLAKQGVKVYKGNYEQNKVDINKGFDNYDYELQGLTSRDSLKSKLGSASGIYTVVLTEFTGTGDSPNNVGLVGVPYFDILGLNTTDLSGLFKGSNNFNQDITNWDVSNVSNMSNMFEGASSFNVDLFDWGVKENVLHVGFNEGATNLPGYKLPKVWQEEYKVVFKDRGNMVKTIHEGYHNRPLSSTSKGDLSLPTEPERPTYEFTGWETSEGLTYRESMVMPNNDVVFEAQWKKVKVEIDTGDDIIDVEVDEDGNITLPEVEDKEDEEFVGWEDQDGNIIEGGEDVEFTEGDSFTPIWKPKEYTVRFLSEGSVVGTQVVKHGNNASAPSNPSREGHTFEGWDKGFTNVTSDITVNAKWVLNPIKTMTFKFNESTSSSQSQELNIPNLYEVVSVNTDRGTSRVTSTEGNKVGLALAGRSYDRRVQTGGSYTSSDSKEVTNQPSSSYNSGGYSGTLSSYVHSGSYTPSDTKFVTGQTSSSYNSGGYSGTLSSYVYSGSYTPSHSKTVTDTRTGEGGHSANNSSYINYNSGGYSGMLYETSENRTLLRGSAADSKTIRDHAGDYSDRIMREQFNGRGFEMIPNTFHPDKWGDPPNSIYYNSGGYSGTLTNSDRREFYRKDPYTPKPSNPKKGDIWVHRRVKTRYYYSGTVSRPETRWYRIESHYSGTVTRPASDTRTWRYRGDVTRPASADTRVYRYRGEVTRPASDTRTYDYFYQYEVTVQYREKDSGSGYSSQGLNGASEVSVGLNSYVEENKEENSNLKQEIKNEESTLTGTDDSIEYEKVEEDVEEDVTYKEVENINQEGVKNDTVSVRLYLNGGTYGEVNDLEVETEVNSEYFIEMGIRRGDLVDVFTERLVRKGHTFVGWKDVKTGDVYKVGKSESVDKDVHLQAIWEKDKQ